MKYLFILLLVLVVIWSLKRGKTPKQSRPDPTSQAPKASEMVTCVHCGIHLPQEEAVMGQKGLYCSTDHRAASQDRNPG